MDHVFDRKTKKSFVNVEITLVGCIDWVTGWIDKKRPSLSALSCKQENGNCLFCQWVPNAFAAKKILMEIECKHC